MKNNEQIVFERQGEQRADMVQGDIVFVISQSPHSLFKRVDNNLFMTLEISLEEALLGFSRTITHLDGHQVTIKNQGQEIIQPYSWKIIKGEGMPIRGTGDFGELHVKMQVVFPKQLSDKQKQLAMQIFGL